MLAILYSSAMAGPPKRSLAMERMTKLEMPFKRVDDLNILSKTRDDLQAWIINNPPQATEVYKLSLLS